MYSFAQRKDTTVLDEPFYAYYLAYTGKDHPGRKETMEAMENDGGKVRDSMTLLPFSTDHLFIKQMAHHFAGIDLGFLDRMENIFLIRHPEEIINSYAKVIADPDMEDVGIKKEYGIYRDLKAKDKIAAVIDAEFTLKNPEKTLRQLCGKLGMEFDPDMLHWKAGQRPEDGIWAKYWYKNIHRSTGFLPYNKKEIKLSSQNRKLVEECMPYYEEMLTMALK